MNNKENAYTMIKCDVNINFEKYNFKMEIVLKNKFTCESKFYFVRLIFTHMVFFFS